MRWIALAIVVYLLCVALTFALMVADKTLRNDRYFIVVASFLCPWAWMIVVPGVAVIWATVLLLECAHDVIDRGRGQR